MCKLRLKNFKSFAQGNINHQRKFEPNCNGLKKITIVSILREKKKSILQSRFKHKLQPACFMPEIDWK